MLCLILLSWQMINILINQRRKKMEREIKEKEVNEKRNNISGACYYNYNTNNLNNNSNKLYIWKQWINK